ncbi:cell division protein PerM [Trueperella bialowiezensis]|uniref:Uncharacterized protein n=1 Tax=Trueperella bialowiezensis TaxID=312285 RepID=A0A3S4Z4I3_9ACTO|nr:DUF6350 family protein [Trueperella bialowiezensis]VEI12771.1 Uncharacterised protein [Trueperella bialowiezensis]
MKTIDLSREMTVVRAGLTAPFFTWLAMVTFAVVAFTLTASAPMLGDTTWADAARVGTGWWMTTFGGETAIGGVPVSLMPLTFTIIVVYVSYMLFRKREVARWSEVVTAGITQALVVALLGVLIRPNGAWWPAIFGAFALGFGSALCAARHELIHVSWWDAAKPRLRYLLVVLTLLACLVLVVAIALGWSRITQIHGYYLTGVLGGAGLVVLQLAYLPVGAVWALAWLLGAGFAVGTGTEFSSLGVESAPLPAIPIFGALPQVSDGSPWIVAGVCVIFAALAVVNTRREQAALGVTLKNTAVATLATSLVLAVLSLMASGAIGPQNMAEVGPVAAEVFGYALAVIGLPYMAATLFAHSTTHTFIRTKFTEARERRQDTKAESEPDDVEPEPRQDGQ